MESKVWLNSVSHERTKWDTINTDWNADDLIENDPSKHNENVVNKKKLQHLDDIVFSILFVCIRVLFSKISIFSLYDKIFVSLFSNFEKKVLRMIVIFTFSRFWCDNIQNICQNIA